jgi:hypothetical protein
MGIRCLLWGEPGGRMGSGCARSGRAGSGSTGRFPTTVLFQNGPPRRPGAVLSSRNQGRVVLTMERREYPLLAVG